MSEQQPTQVMEQPQQESGANFMHQLRGRGAALLAIAITAGGATAYAVNKSGGNHNTASAASVPALVSSPNQALQNCDNLQFDNAAANPSTYNSDAFLPNTTVTTPEGAKQYAFNLFGENGPLAGKNDAESLAAIMSTVVDAAHQGGFENTNYDYITHFNQALGRYNTAGGRDRAVADCKKAFNTLSQDVGYNDDWANAGETVTMFAAERDKNNNIVGANMLRGTVKEGVTLKGVELKLRNTSKGENGYLSVLVSTDSEGVENGTIFIKGLTVQQFNGKSVTKHGKNPAKQHPHNRPQPNAPQQANTIGGKVLQRSSGTGLPAPRGGSGSSAPSQPGGPVPEKQPNGGATGPKGTGPKGPGKEGHPGTQPSPGQGGGTGTGGGETPTTPGGTTTTTTVEKTTPTPTTTTTVERTTPTPTTTTTVERTTPTTTTTTTGTHTTPTTVTTTTTSTTPGTTTSTTSKGSEPPCVPTPYTPCGN